jgi:hypothetical protein
MAKTDKQDRGLIRKVRLQIRKEIAANSAWQNAVNDIIKAARPRDKKAESQARRAAISIVVSQNAALAAAAQKIFHNVTGK